MRKVRYHLFRTSKAGRAQVQRCASEETLEAYLTSHLTAREAIGLRAHMSVCPACRARCGSIAEFISQLRAALRQVEQGRTAH